MSIAAALERTCLQVVWPELVADHGVAADGGGDEAMRVARAGAPRREQQRACHAANHCEPDDSGASARVLATVRVVRRRREIFTCRP